MINTVVCLLKTSNEYDLDYVERLIDGLKSNIKRNDLDYVCISDNPNVSKYCRYIPLGSDYKGYWNKISMFSCRELLETSNLYFDLDTIIQGDITDITLYDHKFTMLKGFLSGEPASGVMAWTGDYRYIANQYSPDANDFYKSLKRLGDQGFIADYLGFKPDYFQDLFPERFCSYKLQKDKNKTSDVVCFHGKPRPRDVEWKI